MEPATHRRAPQAHLRSCCQADSAACLHRARATRRGRATGSQLASWTWKLPRPACTTWKPRRTGCGTSTTAAGAPGSTGSSSSCRPTAGCCWVRPRRRSEPCSESWGTWCANLTANPYLQILGHPACLVCCVTSVSSSCHELFEPLVGLLASSAEGAGATGRAGYDNGVVRRCLLLWPWGWRLPLPCQNGVTAPATFYVRIVKCYF